MGIRDFVRDISPPWLIGPGTPNTVLPASAGIAERFLYALAFGMDALAQKVDDAIEMRFPGRGDPSALPYIGNDRVIERGFSESDADYSTRLVNWLTTWRLAGEARGVIEAIAGYLSPVAPYIESVLVNYTANTATHYWLDYDEPPTGQPNITRATPIDWTWDSENFVKRKWIIIAAENVNTSTPWVTATLQWGDPGLVWGSAHTLGLDCVSGVPQTLVALARRWQSADTRTQWIVVNLTPATPIVPDATWEHWSKIDTTTYPPRPQRVASRSGLARYIAVDAPW